MTLQLCKLQPREWLRYSHHMTAGVEQIWLSVVAVNLVPVSLSHTRYSFFLPCFKEYSFLDHCYCSFYFYENTSHSFPWDMFINVMHIFMFPLELSHGVLKVQEAHYVLSGIYLTGFCSSWPELDCLWSGRSFLLTLTLCHPWSTMSEYSFFINCWFFFAPLKSPKL